MVRTKNERFSFHAPIDALDFSEAKSEVVTEGDGFSCSIKRWDVKYNLFKSRKSGANNMMITMILILGFPDSFQIRNLFDL